METKKFQVSTNLKGFEELTFTCDNRKDAIAYITNTLIGNPQINPQDLILEEIEIVDTVETLTETAKKVKANLALFGAEFEIRNIFADGCGFIEMHQAEKYPSLSINEISRLLKVLEEVNAELPEGYEVFFSINHECAIRLFLATPDKEDK